MNTVEVKTVLKGSRTVVDNVSFSVSGGEYWA